MATKKQAPDTVEFQPVQVNGLALMYEIELSAGRKLSWESKLDVTCGREDMDELLDRIYESSERASARATITAKREKVLVMRVRLHLQEQLYGKTEAEQIAQWGASRKQGQFRPSRTEQADLNQIMTTIANMRADIPVAEWEVARLEAIIDGKEPPELPLALLQNAMDQQPAHPRPTFAAAAE